MARHEPDILSAYRRAISFDQVNWPRTRVRRDEGNAAGFYTKYGRKVNGGRIATAIRSSIQADGSRVDVAIFSKSSLPQSSAWLL
jgi:hypothetical protein